MKNFVAFTCLLALCAVASAYPQQQSSTSGRPVNPNVEVIRQGMIEKLCSQKYKSTATATTKKPTTDSQRTVRAAPTYGPTCSDFDKLPFSELVEKVKGGLKPVNGRS